MARLVRRATAAVRGVQGVGLALVAFVLATSAGIAPHRTVGPGSVVILTGPTTETPRHARDGARGAADDRTCPPPCGGQDGRSPP